MPIPEPTTENVKAVTRITNNRATIEHLFHTPEFDTHKNTGWALLMQHLITNNGFHLLEELKVVLKQDCSKDINGNSKPYN